MARILSWLNPRQSGGINRHHLTGGAGGAVLALLITVIAVSLLSSAATVEITQHLDNPGKNDGYNPLADQHLPPPTRIEGGPLPATWSLTHDLVRLHNQIQGMTTNSCVGQTIATIAEIETAEAGVREPFSSGFIWNLNNGGFDQGISYTSAFGSLQAYGIPPLAAFWPDGYNGLGIHPSFSAFAAAYPHRAISWFNVSLSDSYTIEALIHSGIPLAIALPFHDTLADLSGTRGPIYADGGSFRYWHSLVAIGYNPAGLVLVNSWPSWGIYQQATLSWSYLANQVAWGTGATIVAARLLTPAPPPTPRPTPKPTSRRRPFAVATWEYQAHLHHWPRIPYLYHGHLRAIAWSWMHDKRGHLPALIGSPTSREQYDKRDHLMVQTFHKRAKALEWLSPHNPVRFRQKGRWVR